MNDYFKIEKITERIIRITDVTYVSMFLAIGETSAVLIDTGTGIGDIHEVVRKFTDKPIQVLITHGHVVHAFGAAPFQDVFMSHLDRKVYMEHSNIDLRFNYVKKAPLPKGKLIQPEMLAPARSIDKIADLKEGDVFNLGNLTLQVYALPGHTVGSMTILFKEDRLLLTGDACNQGTFMFFPDCLSVKNYMENLKAYRIRLNGKYDKIIVSHGEQLLPSKLIDVMIETCGNILKGKDDSIPCPFLGEDVYAAAAFKMTEAGHIRLDGKIGNIIYNKNNLY